MREEGRGGKREGEGELDRVRGGLRWTAMGGCRRAGERERREERTGEEGGRSERDGAGRDGDAYRGIGGAPTLQK